MCTTRWTLTWWELKAVFLAAREAFVGIFLILSQTLISRSQSQEDFKHINPLSWDYLFIALFPLERIYMDAGPARSALNNCDFNIYCIFDMLVMETYMAYFGQLWKWSHYDIMMMWMWFCPLLGNWKSSLSLVWSNQLMISLMITHLAKKGIFVFQILEWEKDNEFRHQDRNLSFQRSSDFDEGR